MKNEFGQPIGVPVSFSPAKRPEKSFLNGRFVRLERMRPDHASALFEAFSHDISGQNWTYLPFGPFENFEDFSAYLLPLCTSLDPFFYSIIDQEKDAAIGFASYLRIAPEAGSIEVGWIHFSPLLQARAHATEAMYLMMKEAFDLGYRRYEWKCDALNAPSRRAAERLGFTFEGIFRQHLVYKGRNRDTAWFSLLDHEWERNKLVLETWLSEENFDQDGKQTQSLMSIRDALYQRK